MLNWDAGPPPMPSVKPIYWRIFAIHGPLGAGEKWMAGILLSTLHLSEPSKVISCRILCDLAFSCKLDPEAGKQSA